MPGARVVGRGDRLSPSSDGHAQARDRPRGRRLRRRPAGPPRSPLPALRRRRAPARLPAHGVTARPARPRLGARAAGHGGRPARRDGHDLADLLDDQADHRRRRDGGVGAGVVRAQRPGAALHPVVQGDPRVAQRDERGTGDRADHRGAAGVAPPVTHVRPVVRVPPEPPRRRPLPASRLRVGRARRRDRARRPHRPRGRAAAELPAGTGVAVLDGPRRARAGRRGRRRDAVRGLRAGPCPRPAGDDRHGLARRLRPRRAPGRAVRTGAGHTPGVPLRRDGRGGDDAAGRADGRRRVVLDGRRLPPLRRDAAAAGARSTACASWPRRRWP